MEPTNARRICRLVAGLVTADREVHELEDELLDDLADAFGLPEDDRDFLFPALGASEAADQIRALDARAQQATLDLLVEMAVVDGNVATSERLYLDVVGQALGMSPDQINHRLEQYADSPSD